MFGLWGLLLKQHALVERVELGCHRVDPNPGRISHTRNVNLCATCPNASWFTKTILILFTELSGQSPSVLRHSPGNTVIITAKSHIVYSCHFLDVINVICNQIICNSAAFICTASKPMCKEWFPYDHQRALKG